MSQKESQAINIARFVFIIGVLFIHFPIRLSSVDGISLTSADTPCYNVLSSSFFLPDVCLSGLFLLSGYLYFKVVGGEYTNGMYVKKIDGRIKSLVVPYLFWNIFWLIYNLLKTYKLHGRADDATLLYINSIGDFFSCFWMRGYGARPDFPIAGYTWFLRDLFIFALMAPIYHYCYQKKYLAEIMLGALLVCSFVKGWYIPGLSLWLYLGGYIAYKNMSLEEIANRVNWITCIISFFFVNIIHYYIYAIGPVLVLTSTVLILKLCLLVFDVKWLLSLSAASTYIYVTHVFVLNVSRHSIVKFLHVENDNDMCVYYVLNSTICVIICVGTYYLLKKVKVNRLLAIMTGGRS